jgi:hypothetical protein
VKTFALPPLVPGGDKVAVAVHLAGSSPHRHLVRASLNGVVLGEASFAGRTRAVAGAAPAALLLHDTATSSR